MNFRTIWRYIAMSRRAREREAAAQYERVHREGVLRDEFARRAHALEAQIAQAHAENCRLRAENRALLNSVLGIAGIPPVIVADPPAQVGRPGADAWLEDAYPSALSSRQRRDVCADEGSAVRVDGEEQKQIPRTTPRAPEDRGTSNSARDSARDDDAVDGSVAANGTATPSSFAGSARLPGGPALPFVGAQHAVPACPAGRPGAALRPLGDEHDHASEAVAPNGAASPSNFAGHSAAMPLPSQTPLASAPVGTNAVTPQKQMRCARTAPRARNDAHAVAPIRRRSWHQIYRMLEFESSRRKEHEP